MAPLVYIHPSMKTMTGWVVVRVNGSNSDTYAARTLDDAVSLAMPDDGDRVEWGLVKASDAGAARLMSPPRWFDVDADDRVIAHGKEQG